MLSEVKSTIWGSNVSQGYQAACFKVRDVELVKNLSAIGIVLKYRAEVCTVTRNTEVSYFKREVGARGARNPIKRFQSH